MDNKTPVLSDDELVRALRNCAAEGSCIRCPFREPGSTLNCLDKMLTDAADRIERSENE